METKKYLEQFNTDLKKAIDAMSKDDIESVINALFKAWKSRSQVFIIGNGGSASTASHFVCDLSKCTIVPGKPRFSVHGLVDNIPLVSALTNDEGWGEVYVEQLRNNFRRGDVVIALSVHGGKGSDKAGAWSENLTKALKYAKDNGGVAIGFSGFDGGAFKSLCNHNIIVPANSTPIVESLHATLEHMICTALKQKIEESK